MPIWGPTVDRLMALGQSLAGDMAVRVTVTTNALDTEGTEAPGRVKKYDAIVDRRRQTLRTPNGKQIEIDQRIFFFGNVPIGMSDRIADDEGEVGPVLYVAGLRRKAGGTFYTEVWCGSLNGSSVGA